MIAAVALAAALPFLLAGAWLCGQRAGVRRERERSNRRAVAMMEVRRAILATAPRGGEQW